MIVDLSLETNGRADREVTCDISMCNQIIEMESILISEMLEAIKARGWRYCSRGNDWGEHFCEEHRRYASISYVEGNPYG
jgi:hypothetical protein